MRLHAALSVLVILSVVSATPLAAQKAEYFMDSEIEKLREFQELRERIELFSKMAEARLIQLGVAEKSKEELERERNEKEKRDQDAQKAAAARRPGARPVPPPKPEPALSDFTRSELLRGYIEAIEEAMDNFDDASFRKRDIRGPLESFEKYLNKAAPKLEKFAPMTAAETRAIQDAKQITAQASKGARDALRLMPKTEQKSNSR